LYYYHHHLTVFNPSCCTIGGGWQFLRHFSIFGKDDLLVLRGEDLEAKPQQLVAEAEKFMSACKYTFRHTPHTTPTEVRGSFLSGGGGGGGGGKGEDDDNE